MRSLRLATAFALGALAFRLAIACTAPVGPGLDPDSMSYLEAARWLVRDGTLRDIERDWEPADSTRPLAHWPPGFPLAIAVPHALGMAPRQSARLVEAIAAFASAAIALWIVSAATGLATGVLATLALLVTPAIVQVHENVLSEPLFIACVLATVACMSARPDRPLLAGLAAAAASAVRYAGIAAVGAAALWALLRPGARRARLRAAAIAAAPGVIVQGAWVARTTHAGGAAAIRTLSLYGQLAPTLAEGAHTVAAWLAPETSGAWRALVAIAVATLVVAACVRGVRATRAREERRHEEALARRLLSAVALTAVCYLGLVLAARLAADPGIPLDERLLSPLFAVLELGVVTAIAAWWRRARRGARIVAAAIALAWAGASLASATDSVRYARTVGNDYAEDCWRRSPLVAWVRAHGAGHALFTNDVDALYFQAGRYSRDLPDTLDASTARALADTLAARRGLVVLFDRSCADIDTAQAVTSELPLSLVTSVETGRVYAR